MERCITFVLGGGGARGALQVGALRALLEARITPDMLVGTSIGAVNAAYLALWGSNLDAVERMERAWQSAATARLLDPHLSRLTLRALLGRPSERTRQRIGEFFVSEGLTQELRFSQMTRPRLALVGANLESGEPVVYGQDPAQFVLDGLFASIALPPWFAPIENDGQFIVDGGALSNLPIQPALAMGATEIIALDLDDPNAISGSDRVFYHRVDQLVFALSRRHVQLETALAEARGVPVHRIELRSPTGTPIWEFRNAQQLIGIGYEIADRAVRTMNIGMHV
jgi:NTE family protein